MPPGCSLPSWALEQQRASWSLGQQRASWALGQQRAALKPRRLHRERERISCGGGVALLRSARTDLLCRTDLLVRQRSLRAQCPPVLQGLWDPWATRLVKSAVAGVVCILRKFGHFSIDLYILSPNFVDSTCFFSQTKISLKSATIRCFPPPGHRARNLSQNVPPTALAAIGPPGWPTANRWP